MFSWWSKHGFPFPDWWSYIYIYGHQFIEGDFIYCTMFYLWHHVLMTTVSTCVNHGQQIRSGGSGIAAGAPLTAMRGLSALRQSGVTVLLHHIGTNNFLKLSKIGGWVGGLLSVRVESICSVWNINSMNLWTSDLWDLWDRWCLIGKNNDRRDLSGLNQEILRENPGLEFLGSILLDRYRITH